MSGGAQAAGIYLGALRHWWWALLLVMATTVGAAGFFTARQQRVYRAAASATVAPAPSVEQASDIVRGLESLERRTVIATFASVAEARETQKAAAALVGLEARELSGYRTRAVVVPSTNIIRVTVEGRDGARAAQMANAVVEVLAARVREMYRVFALRPLEAAIPARKPIRPDLGRNLTVAAIVGLFAGVLLALALEYLRSARPWVAANGGSRPAFRVARRPRHERVTSEER